MTQVYEQLSQLDNMCRTMPLGVAPKKQGLFFSLGLLRNQGIGFERLLTIALMVGAVCSIIGVSQTQQDILDQCRPLI